jgi:hypothetical protein
LDRVDGEDRPGIKEPEVGGRKNWSAEQMEEALRALPFQVMHVLTDRGSCFTANASSTPVSGTV